MKNSPTKELIDLIKRLEKNLPATEVRTKIAWTVTLEVGWTTPTIFINLLAEDKQTAAIRAYALLKAEWPDLATRSPVVISAKEMTDDLAIIFESEDVRTLPK